MAEASDFKFGTQLGFAKAHHKITPDRKKWVCPWASEAAQNILVTLQLFTQWLKLGTLNLAYSLSLPTSTIKPHAKEKWTWSWVRETPMYLGFPFNITATAALSS